MPAATLSTLGELRLVVGEVERLSGRRKDLALLAYVASRGPRGVPRAELAALLWADKDEVRARQSLRQALRDLRGALEGRIDVSPDRVGLVDGALVLDTTEFEADLSADRLQRAVERYRGGFLPDLDELGGEAFRDWLEAERERLRRLCTGALARLTDEAEQRGDWKAAVGWLERWAGLDPFSEPVYARLIQALRLAGWTDRAAAMHVAFVARSRRELGIEPAAEFLRLAGAAGMLGAKRGPREDTSRSSALFSPDLVGRGDEFRRLTDAWQQVREGGAAVLAIEGEEGIGKTRLCEAFLVTAVAPAPDALVLRSCAFAAEREVEWAAMRDLLAGLPDAAGLSGAPDVALAALSELVPALRARFPHLPAPGSGADLLGALHRVLTDVAAEVPVLLFVDDLPTADEESRALLLGLARRLPAGCMLLVTASTAAPGYRRLVGSLREIPAVERLSLAPLDPTGVEALLDSMLLLETAARHELAVRLHEESGGNPFYAVALVYALADLGRLDRDRYGVWHVSLDDGATLPLPATVREAVEARLRHLSPGAREVLGAAAVLDPPIDPASLEAVAARPASEFCDAVEELIARRLLRLSPGAPDHYEFSHDLIRRITADLLGPARQQLLHRRASRARDRDDGDRDSRVVVDDRRPASAGRGSQPRAVWRRAAALLLFTTLVVAALGVTASRGRTVPVSAGMVAVLPFDYRGGDSHRYLGEGLADLLSVKLDGAHDLAVVDPRVLLRGVAGTGQRGIDPGRGRVIAERFGAEFFVLGSVVESGGVLKASAALYGSDGETLATSVASAADETEVLGLVDDLARQLLAGRYRGAAAPLVQVAAVTTGSLPALKAYLEGEILLRAGRFADAAGAFARAAEADTTFALAHYRLSVALEWAAEGDGMIDRAVTDAVRHAHRLPERQRLLVEAADARRRGSPGRAINLYHRVLHLAQDDFEANFQLAEIVFHDMPVSGGSVGDAKPYWQTVLDLDPGNGFALVHLARIAASEDSLARFFDRHAAAVARLPPDDRRGMELQLWTRVHDGQPLGPATLAKWRRPGTYVPIAHVVAFSRDLDASERLLNSLVQPSQRTWLEEAQRAHLLAARGRWNAADSVLVAAEPAARARTLPHRVLLASLAASVSSTSARPRRLRDALMSSPEPDATEDPRIRPYLLGLLDATAGNASAVDARAAELEQPPEDSFTRDLALTIRAEAARRQGRPAQALRLLEQARMQTSWDLGFGSPFHSRVHTRWLRAELLHELGRDEAALRWYASVGQGGPFEIAFVAPAHLRRAEIHDRRGERDEALRHYRRFIELWRYADPELQARVDQARTRAAELERQGRVRG
jgi:DNA-binding SARP family transcriptional activator/tetratricopeptide (TPR) repeat protein